MNPVPCVPSRRIYCGEIIDSAATRPKGSLDQIQPYRKRFSRAHGCDRHQLRPQLMSYLVRASLRALVGTRQFRHRGWQTPDRPRSIRSHRPGLRGRRLRRKSLSERRLPPQPELYARIAVRTCGPDDLPGQFRRASANTPYQPRPCPRARERKQTRVQTRLRE